MSAGYDYGFYVEGMLNAMFIVAGSGNYDRWDTSVLPANESESYGCSVIGTQVRAEIWGILGAILLTFFFLLFAIIYFPLVEYLRHVKKNRGGVAGLAEAAPSSVLDWQLALLREVVGDKGIQAKQMRGYSYGWDEEREKFVVDKNEVFQGMNVLSVYAETLLIVKINHTSDMTEQITHTISKLG